MTSDPISKTCSVAGAGSSDVGGPCRKPFKTFEEMTDSPEHAEELRAIYGDVERVDTMIGMYAQRKPRGFGFSDTAFRLFILMPSRRLESDRFFTRDSRPEIYPREGIDWVESTSMRTLLLRHVPALAPALQDESHAHVFAHLVPGAQTRLRVGGSHRCLTNRARRDS
jgi:hypothetical protein